MDGEHFHGLGSKPPPLLCNVHWLVASFPPSQINALQFKRNVDRSFFFSFVSFFYQWFWWKERREFIGGEWIIMNWNELHISMIRHWSACMSIAEQCKYTLSQTQTHTNIQYVCMIHRIFLQFDLFVWPLCVLLCICFHAVSLGFLFLYASLLSLCRWCMYCVWVSKLSVCVFRRFGFSLNRLWLCRFRHYHLHAMWCGVAAAAIHITHNIKFTEWQ